MKFIISLILMAVLSFAACLYLPWWSIAIVCFIVAVLIRQRPGIAFICGFLSLFILWAGLVYYISSNNGHVFIHKISDVMLKKDSPAIMVILTGLIGAVVGGFAALSGSLLRPKSK